jgi:hypothetical protein
MQCVANDVMEGILCDVVTSDRESAAAATGRDFQERVSYYNRDLDPGRA